MAKASCNCNSSSPAVWGRAFSISLGTSASRLGFQSPLKAGYLGLQGVSRPPSLPNPLALWANRSFAFRALALSFFSLSSSFNRFTSCFAFSLTFWPWSLPANQRFRQLFFGFANLVTARNDKIFQLEWICIKLQPKNMNR
jgi:hypothetical protein